MLEFCCHGYGPVQLRSDTTVSIWHVLEDGHARRELPDFAILTDLSETILTLLYTISIRYETLLDP